MLISHRHKFIFVHVPKTAGSSMTEALRPYCDAEAMEQAHRGGLKVHSHAKDILRVFGPDIWDSYFKFAFERNPWDKIVSLYYSHMQNGYHKLFRPRNPTFRQWMYPFGFWPKKLKPTIDFYSLDRKAVALDFLGRYERLTEDFAEACRRIGLEGVKLPLENKSILRATPRYREHFGPAMRRRIERVFSREIALLGYQF